MAPQASADPGTPAGKKESVDHLHGGFLGDNTVGTGAGLAGGKEGIQEQLDGVMVLRVWSMKQCPMGMSG